MTLNQRLDHLFASAGIDQSWKLRAGLKSNAFASKLQPDQLKLASAMAELTKVFSAPVALAFAEAGVTSLAKFKQLTDTEITNALRSAQLTGTMLAAEKDRCAQLKASLASSTQAKALNGLMLDLGSDWPLAVKADANTLAKADAQTLADWVNLRSDLKVSDDSAALLDAHAALRSIGASAAQRSALIKAGVRSPQALIASDAASLIDLARKTKIDGDALSQLVFRSASAIATVQHLLSNTALYSNQGLPRWWPGASPDEACCDGCDPERSRLSKYAYFVYLVITSDMTLAELDARMHQDFATLNWRNGSKPVPQISLCIDVLRRAFPGRATPQEMFYYMRGLIRGGLALVDASLRAIAISIQQRIASVVPQEFEARLKALMTAPLFSPVPAFTPGEMEFVGSYLEETLVANELQAIKASPLGSQLTTAEQNTAAGLAAEKKLEPVRQAMLPALRKLYKDRANRTDRVLQGQLLIEVDLEPCLMTTRVDQAIASMQAMLDEKVIDSREFAYMSYDTWRADSLARLYPDLRALMRDDPLTGERESWDRGSVLHNRAIVRPHLTQQLALVDDALAAAKLRDGASNSTRDFSGTVYADYFAKGIDAIKRVLEADDKVQQALEALDEDEPGLALAKLDDAEAKLQQLAELVFLGGSMWRDPSQLAPARLAEMSPLYRANTLGMLYNELFKERKAIFECDPNLVKLEGLSAATQRFDSALPNWTMEAGFHAAKPDDGPGSAGCIVHSGDLEGRADRYRRAFYRDGQNFGDCRWTVTILLREGLSLGSDEDGEMIGIISHHSGSSSEYQLVVLSAIIPNRRVVSEDGPTYMAVHFLVLSKLTNGMRRELARSEYFNLHANDQITVSLEYRERMIRGELRWSGRSIVLDHEDNSGTALAAGTVGMIASETLSAFFGPATFDLSSIKENGLPPFYTLPQPGDGRYQLRGEADYYQRHIQSGTGFAADVPVKALVQKTDTKVERTLVGTVQFLQFQAGNLAVSTDALDELLDAMLSLSHHLRFTVIPIRRSQALLRMGQFEQAVDMLHLIYDERASELPDLRNGICGYLRQPPPAFTPTVSHDVRLMRIRLAECYLAWAEWLFRQNTDETRRDARKYVRKVLSLHHAETSCECGEEVQECIELVASVLSHHIQLVFAADSLLAALLAALWELLDALAKAGGRCLRQGDVCAIIDPLIRSTPINSAALLTGMRQATAAIEALQPEVSPGGFLLARGGMSDVKRLIDQGLIRWLPGLLAGSSDSHHDQAHDNLLLQRSLLSLCVPANPMVLQQKRQACLLVTRLRSCRNVLGMEESDVPPLRFDYLVRVARSFADLAVSAEREMLSLRQFLESESYSLLQATNQLQLAQSSIRLEEMRAGNAAGEIQLAALQQGLAEMSAGHYEQLIAEGLSAKESEALRCAQFAAGVQTALAGIAVGAAVAAGIALLPVSAPVAGAATVAATFGGAAAATGGVTWASLGGAVIGAIGATGSAASAGGAVATMEASFERREQEWNYQLGLARWNVAISQQSVMLAIGRFQIAQQQIQIARLQADLARDAVQYLNSKFLNRAMLLWMLRTMREQYRERLNMAIGTAYLAERALAFELQTSLSHIRFDYFSPQRDGLLGATQLITNITELEDRKLASMKQKLQLSKTISLARQMPAEFVRFRQTGTLTFHTLLDWFDNDFQGHYLRLIKSVRVTMLATVPPIDGIHAMLHNVGGSTVVTRSGYQFETRRVVSPASGPVALDSPFSETGVFTLNYEDPLLLPFEGQGVQTQWTLELPPGNNRFDFNSIADVLFTIDFTAEYSGELASQQRATLAAADTYEDVAIPLRLAYPDQWYHLKNRRPGTTGPYDFRFSASRSMFPPQLRDGMTVEHLTLLVSGVVQQPGDVQRLRSILSISKGGDTVPGSRLTTDFSDAASTFLTSRSTSPPAQSQPIFASSITATPEDWTLSFNASAFDSPSLLDRISDILLVITVKGKRR